MSFHVILQGYFCTVFEVLQGEKFKSSSRLRWTPSRRWSPSLSATQTQSTQSYAKTDKKEWLIYFVSSYMSPQLVFIFLCDPQRIEKNKPVIITLASL